MEKILRTSPRELYNGKTIVNIQNHEEKMSSQPISNQRLMRSALIRMLSAIPMLMLLFFLPAGTFRYWEAWVYIAVLMGLVSAALIYLLKKDPALLERRLRSREKRSEQSTIIKVSILVSLLTFLIPGFDHRFGWSNVSVAVVILANLLIILRYVFIIFVWRENSFTARTVEVEQGQKVIATGPYSLVRHPMYLGFVFVYVFSLLALASWWAMIPALLIIPILVIRIVNEEKLLINELEGYKAYTDKTRFRLFPGIW